MPTCNPLFFYEEYFPVPKNLTFTSDTVSATFTIVCNGSRKMREKILENVSYTRTGRGAVKGRLEQIPQALSAHLASNQVRHRAQ